MMLGVLMGGPMHGYGLKAGRGYKIRKEFGINDGQLYPTLNKLEAEGLIEKEVIHQEGAPSKHRYKITDKGKKDFLLWLESSDGEDHSFKFDFIRKDLFFTRCTFIQYLDKEKAINKINLQIEIAEKAIENLLSARQDMIERGLDSLSVKIVEYGIKKEKMRIEWLKDFSDEARKKTGGRKK